MNFIKKNWKNILLILFVILFISKCTSSGNYERKYNKQLQRTEFVQDSMNCVYANSSHYIDSLKSVIRYNEIEIKNLNDKIVLLQKQNDKLANKPVVVNIKKEDSDAK